MIPGSREGDTTSRLLIPILGRLIQRGRGLEQEGRLQTVIEPGLHRGPHGLEVVESRQFDWRVILADLTRDRDLWDDLLVAAEEIRGEEPVETAIGWGADESMRAQALSRDVIGPLVRRYRTEGNDWQWDEERAEELLTSWRSRRGGEPRRRRCLAPLHNSRSMEQVVQIEPGLSIRQLTDPERDVLWRSHGAEVHPGPLNPTIADLEEWHLVVDFRWTPEQARVLDDGEAIETVGKVVRALRLHHAGLTGTSVFWITDDPEERWRRDVAGTLFAPDTVLEHGRHGGRFESQLGPFSADDLRKLMRVLPSAGDGNLPLILDRFDSAYSRHSAPDRLIDLWIALEALVLPDGGGELRYRAALRLAHLVGRGADDKRQVFELARRSYDCRSRVVHGSSVPEEVGRIVEETRMLTREALRRWLLDRPAEGVQGLDLANFDGSGDRAP
jgi:hypothetical protein